MAGSPLIWLLLGCTSAEPDAHVLAEVLSAPDAEGAWSRCGGIRDADARGECRLAVATRGGNDATQDCPRFAAGVWQDECWFQAAEAAGRSGDPAQAAALCAKSGGFVEDCSQHLWQTSVRQSVRHAGSPADALPALHALYCDWEPLLADQSGFEQRFWERGYQNHFERSPTLDLAACEGLPAGHLERCQAAAASMLARNLDEVLVRPQNRARFCSEGLWADKLFEYAPDPRFDAVVERHRRALCDQGLDHPPNHDDPEISPPADLPAVTCPPG